MNLIFRALPFTLSLSLMGCSDSTPLQKSGDAPLRVTIAQVGTATTPPLIEAAGTAALRKEIPLGFTSPGQIRQIFVQEGDRVQRGQVLAVLDTTNVGANLEAAMAERDRAVAERQRIQTLFAQGWVTKARLESAEAAARTADAALRARRFSLDTARVVSPSDGVILARSAEPAQIVDAGTPIVTLGDSGSGFVMRALLGDRDAVRVLPGAAAQVTFEALPGVILPGRVIEVGGRSDRGSGAFTIEIGLSAKPRLRSGLVGKARIAAPASSAAIQLVVPPTAIFGARAEEGFVFVLGPNNQVKVRPVKLGRLAADGIEITAGLQLGERVVTSALDRLRDGKRVDPVAVP